MRIALVPGFGQPASSWDPVVEGLAPDLETLPLEVPDGLDLVATAAALGDAGGRACYAGYSMGGRLALCLALDRPELVERLVLVSASPGIDDPSERRARLAADEALARDVERDGVDAFLGRWLEQPLFASLPREVAGLETRRAATSVSRLAHQLRVLGQGAMEPLTERLDELDVPVLLLVGAMDDKYTRIAATMAMRIGGARVEVVPDAGHALPLERPAKVAHAISSFTR